MINKNQEDKEVYLTVSRAAQILNVSIGTLKKFIYQGIIRSLKTPGGHHRILKSELFRISHPGQVSAQLKNINKDLLEVTEGLINIAERRLSFSHGHSASVAKISCAVGRGLKLSSEKLQRLKLVALLHDVGKLGIDGNILNKPSRLSSGEYNIIKTHPAKGEEMLKSIKPFSQLASIVRQHHERFDGRGYPNGLRRDQICQEAKIIALADSFDAMTAENSYKKPLPINDALAEIERNASSQFDPQITKVFLKVYRE